VWHIKQCLHTIGQRVDAGTPLAAVCWAAATNNRTATARNAA
jgi:hypothetical protein